MGCVGVQGCIASMPWETTPHPTWLVCDGAGWQCVCVCVCASMCLSMCVSVYVSVCVCERESESERVTVC